MKMKYLTLLLFLHLALNGWCKDLSPLEWGFEKATTSIERYSILENVHKEAVKRGVNVDYSGMPKTIEIEIPQNADPIPLTNSNNFRGITFRVYNKQKDIFLFERKGILSPITLDKQTIDDADFRGNDILNKGKCLVVIEDANYWTERTGYGYSVKRRDILFLNKGIGKNKVIQPYNNEYSLPECYYRYVNEDKTIIKDLKLERLENSSKKTYLLMLENLNDIVIEKVIIKTPTNNMYGDMALNIVNCANVSVNDVDIRGSYSQKDKYGYGIHMNNVYNSFFKNIKATALWGIFGTNNINKAILEKCDINRFDIHCYGKDVYCKNTIFSSLYNQFSSFYGELTFEKCWFKNFTPVLLEPSYNAYTDFQLKLIDCKWMVNESKNFLLYAGLLGEGPNKRKELEHKFLPNIYIKNLDVFIYPKVKNVYLFNPQTVSSSNKIIISRINIDGMKFRYPYNNEGACWNISTKEIRFEDGFVYSSKRIKLLP